VQLTAKRPVRTQVCNHPFQCNGFQDDFHQKWIAGGGNPNPTAQLVAASGKMVLLDKLLPKLKAGGHKVCSSRPDVSGFSLSFWLQGWCGPALGMR